LSSSCTTEEDDDDDDDVVDDVDDDMDDAPVRTVVAHVDGALLWNPFAVTESISMRVSDMSVVVTVAVA
jgi:hypothetical protein